MCTSVVKEGNGNYAKRSVQGITLFYLYDKKNDGIDEVTIQQLKDRIAILNPTLLNIDLMELWKESNWINITETYGFKITDDGIKEVEKRKSEGEYY